jgi:PhoH-like ATPase
LLYDSNAIKNFEEHNVAIPIQVLEEMDNFKKGNDTKNFEARAFIRFVDHIAKGQLINDWIPLNSSKKGRFKVVIHNEAPRLDAEKVIGFGKYDHKILNCAISLQEEYPDKKVILVSKDICLRLKAKALNILAEDYETGKIKNISDLYTGYKFIKNVSLANLNTIRSKGFIKADEVGVKNPMCNEYFILKAKGAKDEVLAYYEDDMKALRSIEDYEAFGIKALNPEQQFALHALMNPRVRLVTIQGVAGTGKTLLALASALEQRRDFRQIFVSRPIIPLANNDIGFLPGDIKDKVDPYMQSLWDNLNFIKDQFRKTDKKFRLIEEMQKSEKIAIAPLAYIRGRSLVKIFFIVDEAQNLTPHEVKTIISRAGDDTKIVFMGDVHQIDTPYLDSQSNGLSYLIDKIKDNPLFAHITLQKGERSELANIANSLL